MRQKMILYTINFFCIFVYGLALASGNDDDHQESEAMEDIAIILGVCTLFLLATTFFLGKFMPKNRAKLFKLHKASATLTLILALCHAFFILFFH